MTGNIELSIFNFSALMCIPYVCQFSGTTLPFWPLKKHQIVRKFATKKPKLANWVKFRVLYEIRRRCQLLEGIRWFCLLQKSLTSRRNSQQGIRMKKMRLQSTSQYIIQSKLETKTHLNSNLKRYTENPLQDCVVSQISSTGPDPRYRWTEKVSGTSEQY